MKTYLLCLLPLALAACRDQPATEVHDAFWANTRPDSVVLKNGLGTVQLRVPRAYDTSFAWLRLNDVLGNGDYRYRFQPRRLPIYKESGFFLKHREDSVNQLTIVHAEYVKPETHRAIGDSMARQQHRDHLTYFYTIRRCPSGPLPCPFKHDFDTLTRINGRYFSIIAYSETDSLRMVTSHFVAAHTFGGTPVRFTYELRTRQNDSTARHFQRDALRLLRTIRIRPGR